MGLLDRVSTALAERRSQPERRYSADMWLSDYLIPAMDQFSYGGAAYPFGVNFTQGGIQIHEIAATLPGYSAALRACPPAFAAQLVRALVISQARFTFRNRASSRTPRRVFGTSALGPLERPWTNATTGELLARMEWHAGLAGNAYVTSRSRNRLRVLRPDWVAIVYGSDQEPEQAAYALDGEVIGYVYAIGGLSASGGQLAPLGGGRMYTLLPEEVSHWCVDEETEILTAAGWKDFRTLDKGDEALTLNHETGLAEWQPVLEVCIFPAQPREMVLMEGREFSSLSTTNHRWAVERRSTRTRGYVRRWATSAALSAGDRIPLAAYGASVPVEAKWSDALVEAIAWFWTEGRYRCGRKPGTHGRGVEIAQSLKNPDNLERIRAALVGLFGPAVARIPKTGSRTAAPACWREAIDDDMTIFRLSANASDVLTQHAPGKVVQTAFLRSLTQAQLELFIHVSMLADNNGEYRLAQKSRAMAEQFALACILAGRPVSIRPGSPKLRGYRMTNVRMLRKRHVYPQPTLRPSRFRVERIQYGGHVWCPRTANQTWLARRRGSVYFTGNSPIPDPEGSGIGQSWITPALADIKSDRAATETKIRFFKNGATPNMVVKGLKAATKTQFDEIVEMLEARHSGVANAFKTLYLTEGADASVVGSNFRDMDLKAIQGASETRVSSLSRVPASLLGIAEGLAGSSLNAGNFGMARRIFADTWVYPTLQDLSAALAPMVRVPSDAELWFDASDIPLLREDGKDAAEIEDIKATTITKYVREGFTAESAIAAVRGQDVSLLVHTNLVSVQLQPPGTTADTEAGMSGSPGKATPPGGGPTTRNEDFDDEPDEDTAALIQALAEFAGEQRSAAFDPALHPRNPKGTKGGGRFRSIVGRIADALEAWAKGDGSDDPLKDFDREQLRQAAKARGLTLRRGASRDEIHAALLEDLRGKVRAGRDEPKQSAKFTLQGLGKPDPAKVREVEVENRIRAAYRDALEAKRRLGLDVSDPDNRWVSLADIRDGLGEDFNRLEVDAVLRDMRGPGVRVINVANTKALKQRDLDAALPMGGQSAHAMSVADPSPRPLPDAKRSDLSNVDVAVYRDPQGRPALFREDDAGKRGALVRKFGSLDEMAAWADANGEPRLAEWARKEAGGKGPAKAVPGATKATPKAAPVKRTPPAPGFADDLAEEFYRNPHYTKQEILDRLDGLTIVELKRVATATNVEKPRDFHKTTAGPVVTTPKKLTADEWREHIAATIVGDRTQFGSTAKVVPTPAKKATPKEDAARARQADIDKARRVGDLLAEIQEMHGNDADPDLVRRTVAAQARRNPHDDLQPIIDAVESGDRATIDAAIRQAAIDHGLTPTGIPGHLETFNPRTMTALGARPRDGSSALVEIVRPGYSYNRDGETIQLSKAVVEAPAPAKKSTPAKKAAPAAKIAALPTGADIELAKDFRDLAPAAQVQGHNLTPAGQRALDSLGPPGHPRLAAIPDTEGKIREAYRMLQLPGQGTDSYVALEDVRKLIGDQVPRSEVDDTLRRMWSMPDVQITPQSYGRQNVAERLPAAIMIGGQEQNLLHIDDPTLARPKQFAAVDMAQELVNRRDGGPRHPMMVNLSDADLRAEVDRRIANDPITARDVASEVPGYAAKKATPAKRTPGAAVPKVDVPDTTDPEALRDALDLRTVPELKAMLKARGLPVSGRKRELVDRLVDAPAGAESISDAAAKLEGLTNRQKRARLRAMGFTSEQIDEVAPLARRSDADRDDDELRIRGVIRAAGRDVTPGDDELHHYWTRGEGLAKWAESPKPWTTLVAHLTKYVGPEKAKVFASRWFHEVFGFYAGSDLNRVTHGKPPRGKVIGPG